jgi:hypothetical protein
MIEAASTSEKSISFYQTTRSNNPEDSHLKKIPDSETIAYFKILLQ